MVGEQKTDAYTVSNQHKTPKLQAWVTKCLWKEMVEENGAEIKKLNRIQDTIYDSDFFHKLKEHVQFPEIQGGHARIREFAALMCANTINRVAVCYYFNENAPVGRDPDAHPKEASLNFYTGAFCSMMFELKFDADAISMPAAAEKVAIIFRDLMWQGNGGFAFSEKHETVCKGDEAVLRYSYEASVQLAGFATPCHISTADTWLASGTKGWWRQLPATYDETFEMYEPSQNMSEEMADWEKSHEAPKTHDIEKLKTAPEAHQTGMQPKKVWVKKPWGTPPQTSTEWNDVDYSAQWAAYGDWNMAWGAATTQEQSTSIGEEKSKTLILGKAIKLQVETPDDGRRDKNDTEKVEIQSTASTKSPATPDEAGDLGPQSETPKPVKKLFGKPTQ